MLRFLQLSQSFFPHYPPHILTPPTAPSPQLSYCLLTCGPLAHSLLLLDDCQMKCKR